MSHSDTKARDALAGLVGLILSNNPEAGLYEQFANIGKGKEYSGAMKQAILVLHQQGALHGIEQRLGVKFPNSALNQWLAEESLRSDGEFPAGRDALGTSTPALQ